MPSNYAVPTQEGNAWMDFWARTMGQPMNPYQRPDYTQYMANVPWWQQQSWESDPRSGYGAYSALAGSGESQALQNWMSNQYTNYYDQYQAWAGGDPTLWWNQYLSAINPYADFSFTQPYTRGERQSLFSPTLRMVT